MTVIIVMAVALLLALILGVQLGSGDYQSASIWLVIGLVIVYVTHLHHYTWQIVIFSVFLGFTYRPAGFAMDAQHIGLALGGLLAILYLMAPITYRPEQYLPRSGIKGMKICLAIWVGFGAIHMVWNHLDPYMPSQYAFKNALKTYVEAFGGPAIILWFMIKPSGFRVGRNWAKTVVVLFFFAMVINIGIQLYNIYTGYGAFDPYDTVPGLKEVGPNMLIPVLNASPGQHALRYLSPIAVALGLIFLTSPTWFSAQGRWTKLIVIGLVFLGLAGAALSAGRAVPLLCGFYAFVIALLRRKTILIMTVGVAGMFFLILVNVFSTAINESAPYFVQRSLQYFMIEKGGAAATIKSSTDWRDELANRAYDEWRSDERIFFLGRASYSFGETDIALYDQLGHYEAIMEISLRRGNAHRLTADCLIQYGIVGLILFYIMQLSIMCFLVKLYKVQKGDPSEFRDLTFVLIVFFGIGILMTFVISSWVNVANVWLLLLLIIGYSQELRSREMSEASEKIKSRGIPQHAGAIRI